MATNVNPAINSTSHPLHIGFSTDCAAAGRESYMERMGRAVDCRVDIGRHAGTATAGDFWRSLVYLSPLESGAGGAEADPVAGVAISDLRRGGGVHDHARSGQVSRGVL